VHFELRDRFDKPLSTLEGGFQVPEESPLQLFLSEPIRAIWWNGNPLESSENYHREPWAWAKNAYRWELRPTDFVGRNDFELETASGRVPFTLYVYPAKLSSDPQAAWRWLRHIVGRVPSLTEKLGFPLEVQGVLGEGTQALEGNSAQGLETLHTLAPRLNALSERLLSAPEHLSQRRFRLERGGQLSGAVDWEATLDHWGSGGAVGLEHVLDGRQRVWNTPTYRLLLHFWDFLVSRARAEAALDPQFLRRLEERRGHFQRALPGVGAWQEQEAGLRPASSAHRALLGLWSEASSAALEYGGLPQGSLGMAALFEVWVACELAALLGCTRRSALEDREGQLACTFQGPDFLLDYNIPIQFQGVGAVGDAFGARPDIFVRSSDKEERIRFVVDVKYRNLGRLEPKSQRDINNQMRAYMGDYHARLGLVLWPGNAETEPLRLDNRGPYRGSIGAMQFCPQDKPTVLKSRLREALEKVQMGPLPGVLAGVGSGVSR